MRILVAHNFYQQGGGEDQCVAAEVALMRAHGHEVIEYYLHNDAIEDMHALTLAWRTIWSRPASSGLRELIRKHRPSVAHFHNTFPLMSPAAYYAVRSEKTPVIQTLHNFRLVCPNALFFRNGRVCEDCLGRPLPWPGIVHKCYRGSGAASAATATMLATHRALGTWRTAVDVYIALSDFSRKKLISGGLPRHKIVVKPNFVFPDPGPGKGAGDYALFVGRLSAEKGLETLLQAWEVLNGRVTLKIVGDGPMKEVVRQAASRDCRIQWLGSQPSESVYGLVGEALVLVLPSRCYENFPRVVVEAFAKGTPVLCSKLGAMAELVDHGRTGLHFAPGDALDLAAKVRHLLNDPTQRERLRRAAREEYESKYTAEANYLTLQAIYNRAVRASVANCRLGNRDGPGSGVCSVRPW